MNTLKEFPWRRFRTVIGSVPLALMALGAILSIFIGLVETFIAFVLQLLLRVFGLPGAPEFNQLAGLFTTTLSVLILLCAAFFIKAFMTLVAAQCLSFANESFNCSFKNLAAFDFLYSKNKSKTMASDLLFRFQESIPKTVASLAIITQFFTTLLQLIVILASMLLMLPIETLGMFLGIVLLGVGVNYISKRLTPISRKVVETSQSYNRLVQRAIPNKVFFQIMKTSDDEYQRLSGAMGALSASVVSASFYTTLAGVIPVSLGVILISIIIYYSSEFRGVTGLVLMSYIYLLMRLMQIFSGLGAHISTFRNYSNQIQNSAAFLSGISASVFESWSNTRDAQFSFLGAEKKPNPVSRQSRLQDAFPGSINVGGEIAVNNLHFKYDDAFDYVIKGLSFHVPAGGQIGIIGKSGAGKSTLLKILMGLEAPTSGLVSIDGSNASQFINNIKNRIGYVGVEPFLFYGTLKENITYGIRRQVTDEEIFSTLRRLKLDSFASAEKLNVVLGEDLSGLSAGQKQRICMVRALLNKPVVLILDEATSNLDPDTEDAIALDLQTLKGQITTVIVAHRKGIIQFADRVISVNAED